VKCRRYQFACPYCGGIFFTAHVSMDRRPNRLPRLRSMRGDVTCDECGLVTDLDSFIRWHRGWEQQPSPMEVPADDA